jgi:hypothetical protein
MRRRGVVALTVGLALASGIARASSLLAPASSLLEDVKALTAAEMDGRESGTAGAERAAAYIAEALRAAGVRPAGEGGSYHARFPVPSRVRPGDGNALAVVSPAPRAFALGSDWTPTAGSADGQVEGEVVFVGYGISEPELGYDDYGAVDVRDRVVLALAGEPRQDDPASPFSRAYTASYGRNLYKVRVARDRGARALLLVPGRPGADTLPAASEGRSGGELVSVAVTRASADALLAPAGLRIDDLRERIDFTLQPLSRSLPVRARVAVALERERGMGANVLGILPGTDPALAAETVVIGAHYDHLGRSGDGSLDAHRTTVHPGADDNASGTAAALAVARYFAARGGAPRALVFALFAGEEMGLLGSAAYVRDPPFPLERTVAMVNLDMVGRMRDGRVYVGGLGSGRGLDDVVRAAARGIDVEVVERQSPYAPSDHLAFVHRRVPVLFFHTGVHEDYHRTTDTWDRLNVEGLARVVALATRIVDRLARGPAPTWVRVEPSRARADAGPTAGAGGGTFFGVADDGSGDSPGVRLALVQPDSPAGRADVRPGDVVVRFDGARVYTLDDLRAVIHRRRPGDTVEVVYLRDGVERAVRATLGARP